MQPKIALTIGAVVAALLGLILVLVPGPTLEGFGLQTPDEGIILSRDLGVTLLGLAVVNWLARDATGPAVRAILIGNAAIQGLEILVNGYAMAVGMLAAQAAGGLLLHAVLGAIFILGLRRARRAVPA